MHMKIIHFHPDWRYGEKFVVPLINYEKKYGFTSILVTHHRTPKNSKQLKFNLELSTFYLLPVIMWQLIQFLLREKPEILIAHNTRGALIPMLIARIIGLKTIIYFNHGVPFLGYGGIARWFLMFLERVNCRLSDHVIAVSTDMKEVLCKLCSKREVSIIGNGSACGIDLSVFTPDDAIDGSWREENGFEEADYIVGYIGRPVKRKGLFTALDVWKMNGLDPHIKLAVFGVEKAEISKLAPDLPNSVKFFGFKHDIHKIFPNLDLLILPSQHEGFSYAVVEAMACKVLVLVNNLKGVGGYVKDGSNGFIVSDNSVSQYFQRITEIANSESKFEEIKSNALETAKSFSREDFLPAYISTIIAISELRGH